jgi:very-short-patch-repair endonuclease
MRDPLRDNARHLRKSITPEEVKLWVRLRDFRKRGFHFRRQALISGYIVDFVCKSQKLVVEVDGGQHGQPEGTARDLVRDTNLRHRGYRILRLWNADVNRNPDDSADTILAVLNVETPPASHALGTLPALARQEGEIR